MSVLMVGPYLNVEEAAQYMKLARATLYKYAVKDLIPSRKHFGKRVFVIAELDAWSAAQVKAREKPVSSQTRFQSARERICSLKTQTTDSMPAPAKGA